MTDEERKKRAEAVGRLLAAEDDFLHSLGWRPVTSGSVVFWEKGKMRLSKEGAISRVKSEERMYQLYQEEGERHTMELRRMFGELE